MTTQPDAGEPMVPMADVIRVTGYNERWWRKYARPWPVVGDPDTSDAHSHADVMTWLTEARQSLDPLAHVAARARAALASTRTPESTDG